MLYFDSKGDGGGVVMLREEEIILHLLEITGMRANQSGNLKEEWSAAKSLVKFRGHKCIVSPILHKSKSC